MKKVLAVAAALIASTAQATSGLDFGDLNYFLKTSQFNLTSNISIVNAELTDQNSKTQYETNGYVVDNRVGYGIADNLNVFVGLDFAFDYKVEQKGSQNSHNGGLSNPYLGANYRLLNQKDSMINLDFGAVARVRLMDAEYGYGGKSGTFNRGNHSLELNSSIGQKWNEANEWRLTAAVTRQFAGDVDVNSQSGTQNADIDASTDFSLTAGYQYRPVQEFMMNLNAQAQRIGEIDSKSGGANITQDSHMDYNFTFSAKYLITDNFIAKFNYGQSHLSNYDQTTSGTVSTQQHRSFTYYGWGVDWLF
jgi:hypothetical protein